MIAHLEKNGHTLFATKHLALYSMVKDVVNHSLGESARPKRKANAESLSPRDADREVEAIAYWLRRNARPIQKGERRITHRPLRQILGQHGFEMCDPKCGSIRQLGRAHVPGVSCNASRPLLPD